jgi:hypothetical protein
MAARRGPVAHAEPGYALLSFWATALPIIVTKHNKPHANPMIFILHVRFLHVHEKPYCSDEHPSELPEVQRSRERPFPMAP